LYDRKLVFRCSLKWLLFILLKIPFYLGVKLIISVILRIFDSIIDHGVIIVKERHFNFQVIVSIFIKKYMVSNILNVL